MPPARYRARRKAAGSLGSALTASTLGTNLRNLLSIRKDIFTCEQTPGPPLALGPAPGPPLSAATTAHFAPSCAKLSNGFKQGYQAALQANFQGTRGPPSRDSILQLLVKQECCEDYPALPPPPPPPAKGTGRARYPRDARGDACSSSKRCPPRSGKTPSPPPICILAAAGTAVANFGPLGRAQQPAGPQSTAAGAGGGGPGGGGPGVGLPCQGVGGGGPGGPGGPGQPGPIGGPIHGAGAAGSCCGPLSVVASHNIGMWRTAVVTLSSRSQTYIVTPSGVTETYPKLGTALTVSYCVIVHINISWQVSRGNCGH